jgi:hypothetical protein
MDDPPVRVPDGIEPISAYRAWNFSIEHGRADLYPFVPHHGRHWYTTWKGAASGWVTASCLSGGQSHGAPSELCTCGFYALKVLEEANRLAQPVTPTGPNSGEVLGRILLSGKVIEHDAGYRAQRARIVELIPFRGTERSVMVLANRLGVRMAPAVEPITHELDEDLLNAMVRRPPPSVAIVPGSDDAMADSVLGLIPALFLFTAAALHVAGVWVPPLGLVLAAMLMLGQTSDPLVEAYRSWRRRRG